MNVEEWLERGLVSPSDMNAFLPESGCPMKWKFGKEGRPGMQTDKGAMMLGSNIHDMIAMYFGRISDRPTEAAIRSVADGVWDEAFNERELRELKKRGERCWKNFVNFELDRRKTWKVYKPTLTEARLKDDKYVGIVDFHSDPQKTCIDWKTGKLDYLRDSELRQGKVYQTMLGNHGHTAERCLFVALYTGRVLEMPVVTDGWLERERARMLGMVEKGEFPRAESGLCHGWCPWQLDCQLAGVCLWV